MGRVVFIPVRVAPQRGRFDLVLHLLESVRGNGESIRDGDVLVISAKFVSMSEGRVVRLEDVKVSEEAEKLAEALGMSGGMAELVLREADRVYGGVPGFALAIKDGVIAPNAGIDRSNVYPGHAILYPAEPSKMAEAIRSAVTRRTKKRVAVILSDSRLMPTRLGTTGVAIGVAGLKPVKDERGRRDLFGNTLRYTQRAIADDICAGAQLLMGEADEAVPVLLVRHLDSDGEEPPWMLTDEPIDRYAMAVKPDECIFLRGLSQRD